MAWWGWGDPRRERALSPELRRLLDSTFGAARRDWPPGELADVRLPEPALAGSAREQLQAIVGIENVRADREARVRHTRGRSTVDLLRLRAGDGGDAPDAVVLPGSHEQVLAVLRLCSELQLAVVPFGGGTSVVGGLAPARESRGPAVALDLRRLDRLLELDETSRVARLQAGLRGPEAEALLLKRGYTIGHHPQSFEYATIGGFAATRSSGQASAGYGRFDERVVGLTVATPRGTIELGRAPRSAAGPDVRQLFLGSEGAFGVITAVAVEVSRAPAARAYEGWRFGSFADGAAGLRRLAQDGPTPAVLRLSDEAETALGASGGPGCLAIVGYEGDADAVARRRRAVATVLRELGARPEPGAGEAWLADRDEAPYLRDALLDAGVLTETVETASFWSKLPALYRAVGDALLGALGAQGAPAAVLCHISHVYPSGASLYFTAACAMQEDPLAQWRAAKAAASDAIIAAGGTITHHHGVGTDHRAWLEREAGPLPTGALRAAKAELDPAGILNPGVLVE
jgi:alkyldihydroxyacetonephosphate synthase